MISLHDRIDERFFDEDETVLESLVSTNLHQLVLSCQPLLVSCASLMVSFCRIISHDFAVRDLLQWCVTYCSCIVVNRLLAVPLFCLQALVPLQEIDGASGHRLGRGFSSSWWICHATSCSPRRIVESRA